MVVVENEKGPSMQVRPVAAIGNFDGVHMGHQFLLQQTKALADEIGAPTGVVVFDPHPRRYFKPDEPPFRLGTPAQRDALLKSYGVDEVISLPFNMDLAQLSPEAFVNEILIGKLDLQGVVTGAEFRFGKARAGDATMLKALFEQAGRRALTVTPLDQSDVTQKIGSSAVRNALREGKVKHAADLLGRQWSVFGVVQEGRRLGRTIGFATANVFLEDILAPKFGVYAVMVKHGGKEYQAVANFGVKPTVGSDQPVLEAHLFDFDKDIYGDEIEVVFYDFLRPEAKFDGLDALKAQIAADAEAAKASLSRL